MPFRLDDRTLGCYRRIDEAMREPLMACSVPLYLMRADGMDPWGTGTLFQIAESRLMVTASHVVKEALKLNGTLYTANVTGGPIFRLDGKWAGSPDPWDVCVLELDDRACRELSGLRFLRLNDVERTIGAEAGWFYLYGFPATWMKPVEGTNKVRPQAMKYGVGPYCGGRSTLKEYDPNIHMLFEIGRGGATTPADGSPADLPACYGGISGSSVWRATTEAELSDSWDVTRARVVGVQTSVYGDRIAKATRWEFVLNVVLSRFPDLMTVVALHQPDGPLLIK